MTVVNAVRHCGPLDKHCLRPLGFLLLLVVVENIVVDVLGEDIHFGLLELPGADITFEKEIHFRERAACRLGYAEIGVGDAKKADATLQILLAREALLGSGFAYPEKSSKIAPVPCSWVQHVRGDNTAEDANNDAIRESAKPRATKPETGGTH